MMEQKGIGKTHIVRSAIQKECDRLCSKKRSLEEMSVWLNDINELLLVIDPYAPPETPEGYASKEAKAKLVNRLTEKTSGFVDRFFDEMSNMLKEGWRVILHGVMTLEVVPGNPVHGRDFESDKAVVYPPSKKIRCKVSRLLKEMINEDKNGNCTED